MAAATTTNGRRDAERPYQQRGHRRAEGEAEHVGGEELAQVLAEVVRVGEDDDATSGRNGSPDADAGDEPPDQDGCQRRAETHQQQPNHVDAHAEQHDSAGMTSVGQGSDQDLGQEGGDEADPDHDADRGLADAVLVAVVADDR